MRILLTEDDRKIGQAIGALLQRWGHEVVICRQSEQALETLEERDFDLLIADWLMPGLNGTDLVRRLKADERLKALPVLMISGKAEKADILEAIQAGIDGFLAKPFSPDQLKEKIATLQDIEATDGASKEAAPAPQETDTPPKAKNTLLGRLQAIFSGHRADPAGDNPLVVFTERATAPEELLQPTRRSVARFLLGAVEAINAFNAEYADLGLGYLLCSDVHDLRDILRHPHTRDRVKLVLVHLEADQDEHFLFARLVSINQKRNFSLIFLCDSVEDVLEAHRQKFDQLGIGLYERKALDPERLRTMLTSNVLASLKAPSETTLRPEEVRQRVLTDLEGLDSLPILPRVHHRIEALSRTPGSDLGLWVRALKADPITCASILRHARSPLYGFHERVEEIDRALILLGKRVVRDLVTSEAVKRAFEHVEEQGFSLDALWRHSVAVGSTAHLMAFPLDTSAWNQEQQTEFGRLQLDPDLEALLRRLDLPHRLRLNYAKENPFMGGMLHDIGKIAMAHAYPGLYPIIEAELGRRGYSVPYLMIEREVAGGLTHTIVGELLGKAWDLDPPLRRVIQNHHHPEIDDTFSFLIGIADFIAQSVCPFPAQAEYPVVAALEAGDLRMAADFLPAGFFEQPLLSDTELLELALAARPAVERLTADMQQSIG